MIFKVMLGDRGLPEFRRRMLQIVQEKVYGDLLSSIVESDEELGIPKEILLAILLQHI